MAIDFGVPPNLDPEEARGAGIVRIGMSELVQEVQERRVGELLRLAPVRAAIDERLARLREDMATRAIGPQLAELRDAFERIAADELERALSAELRGLTEPQREAMGHSDLAVGATSRTSSDRRNARGGRPCGPGGDRGIFR